VACTDCKNLSDKVEERAKDALKLEGAEIKLIQTANKRRLKWEKKGAKSEKKGNKKTVSPAGGADAEVALAGSQYQKHKDRFTHRLGKVPLIEKKVDTIE
jgi:hypothetical protein